CTGGASSGRAMSGRGRRPRRRPAWQCQVRDAAPRARTNTSGMSSSLSWLRRQGPNRSQVPPEGAVGLVAAEGSSADRVLEVPREGRVLLPDPLDGLADAAGDGLARPVARVRRLARPAAEPARRPTAPRAGTRSPYAASPPGPSRPTGLLRRARPR